MSHYSGYIYDALEKEIVSRRHKDLPTLCEASCERCGISVEFGGLTCKTIWPTFDISTSAHLTIGIHLDDQRHTLFDLVLAMAVLECQRCDCRFCKKHIHPDGFLLLDEHLIKKISDFGFLINEFLEDPSINCDKKILPESASLWRELSETNSSLHSSSSIFAFLHGMG